jgi:hypothetical protein
MAQSSSYTPKQANFKEIQNRDFIKPMQTEVSCFAGNGVFTSSQEYLTIIETGENSFT